MAACLFELIGSWEMCIWLVLSNDILRDCLFAQNEEMNYTAFPFTLKFWTQHRTWY